MQLLIILALLLYGGKSNAQKLLTEVKPVLESLGGEEMQNALKSAEEISQVLSAVQSFASPIPTKPTDDKVAFPLAPVSAIADRDITYSLSKYISEQA